MNARENQVINLIGEFHAEVEIPDGTDGALHIVPSGTTVPSAPLQVELSVIAGVPSARVRIDGVWTQL